MFAKEPSAPTISKSKCRRLRAAAVRHQLWKSAHEKTSCEATARLDMSESDIHSKLNMLEYLILDLHWAAFGQWHAAWGNQSCEDFVANQSGLKSGFEGSPEILVQDLTFKPVVEKQKEEQTLEDQCPTGLECVPQPVSSNVERTSAKADEAACGSEAATRIQSVFRGYQTRTRLHDCGGASSVSSESSLLSDKELEVVMLPLPKWREATGLFCLDIESIKAYYAGEQQGVRDYDAGFWYKIDPGSIAARVGSSTEHSSSRSDKLEDNQLTRIRDEIQRRLKALRVCTEVAERLSDASEKDPTNIGKANAAAAAVKRYREAKERATPEAVAEDHQATLQK